MQVEIEQPHGYLMDGDEKVIQRFGNWETGKRKVHPATESVEYVAGPAVHDKPVHEDYRDGNS